MNKYSIDILIIITTCIYLTSSVGNNAMPNPVSSCSASTTTQCPSFCKYEIVGGGLTQKCTSALAATDVFPSTKCTDCDPLLFYYNSTTNTCVPHLLNNQHYFTYKNYKAAPLRLGWYAGYNTETGATGFQGFKTRTINNIVAHYAVRIRFSIYLFDNWDFYQYPLNYSLDGTTYGYDQTKLNYWSCYDIVTSPLTPHFEKTLVVSWANTESAQLPRNFGGCTTQSDRCRCRCQQHQDSCCTPPPHCYNYYFKAAPSCTCGSGCSHSCGGSYCSANCCGHDPVNSGGYTTSVKDNCCEDKYIQIDDLLVFVSRCPANCSGCNSATKCTNCTAPYKLNLEDRLCYLQCPQATYQNATLYFIGGYDGDPVGDPPIKYTNVYQKYCVPCNKTCLQCVNYTNCTRCYTIGRNQSYLFNWTCVIPCPFGYIANMTNHTCDCPSLYHFEIVNNNNITMLCYQCAFECRRCFERTNLNCTQCQKGFYLVNGTTHCLNQCPTGQFIYLATDQCFFCDVSCSACVNTSTTCTACYTNTLKYLFGTKCIQSCPWGYAWNNISRTCDLCDIYTYSYQGKCVDVCPNMYEANLQNRSCIPLYKTGFRYSLVLESVHVLQHGKLLQYTVFLQDGLDTISENWMKRYSYHMVQIFYGNSKLDDFNGIRSLQNLTLTIRNLRYANNRITYSTNIPPNMDYHKSFQVVFLHTLYSQQGIKYNNQTNVYSINQHPELLKEYYTYAARNNYDLILIPFLAIFFSLVALYLRGTYEMFIEVFRVVQLLGVLVYSAFPIGSFTFYFLVGCSYTNFDFLPNLYAMFAKTDTSAVFASYFLYSPDMDFIRLMGSVLFFGVISLVVYVICRFVLNFQEHRLDYMSKLCIDLMEVKILHSFWSSLLYVISNYQKNEFGMYMIFIFAIIFLGALIGRRYSIWKETQDFSPFFVWRMLSTFVICFVALANEIVISVLVIVSLIVTLWNFFMLHSNKYLVSIDNLNSSNYMQERTYRVLNNYDIQVSYSFSITFRNIIITVCPFITSLIAGILILLRDEQTFSIILSSILIYSLVLLLLINSIFIYLFLKERRKFLVNNKLEYLRKKYSKIGTNDTQIFEQRKRPRAQKSINFDDQKYLQGGIVNRNMIKSVDS